MKYAIKKRTIQYTYKRKSKVSLRKKNIIKTFWYDKVQSINFSGTSKNFYFSQNSFTSFVRISTSIFVNIFPYRLATVVTSFRSFSSIYIPTLTNHNFSFFVYTYTNVEFILLALHVTIINNKKLRIKTKDRKSIIVILTLDVNVLDIDND
jgi:hypothetical protein